MKQTKIFDRHAQEMGTFTFDEMLSALSNDPTWTKDAAYLKSIINTRIKNGTITVSNNAYQYVQRVRQTVTTTLSESTFKYPHPILLTPELQNILNHGVETYQHTNLGNLVKLSNHNSQIIEDLISNDDKYKFLFSKRVFDSFCVNGCFARTRDAYCGTLIQIDEDNSTQVFKNHREDFYKILDYIMNDEPNFYERIRRGDISLVDDLMNVCSAKLLSFCSKVCKFLNNWLFNRDDYYIFDYYVLNAIPFYLDYYRTISPEEYSNQHIDTSRLNSREYQDFYDVLSKLHALRDIEFNDQMSKHQLDHVIWYSYRSFKPNNTKIRFN